MGYGDIMMVETTGASSQTAKGDNLKCKGVDASEAMAEMDAKRMDKYKDMISRVGKKYGIDPVLIAGIISRESRAGKALDKGWGDDGKAWGLMQVDITPDGGNHKPNGEWDSEEHLCQGTEILVDFIGLIRKKDSFCDCSEEEQLKGGIAAYNKGPGVVHSYERVDEKTKHGDYSNDVVARAQWYKNNVDFSSGGCCTIS